jgi:prevent-host-death family protein
MALTLGVRPELPPQHLTRSTNERSVVVMDALRTINLYEAKTQLSSLVEEAAAGAEIIIAKAGKPRARLVPVRAKTPRRPGSAKGKVWIAADFDAPLPESMLRAFSGDTSA